MRLGDVKAVVTGGASGLGAATARHLRGAGAKVTIADRDRARGTALAAEIGAGFAEVDVTSEASALAAISAAKAGMGGLNVLINCAGIASGERVLGRNGPHRLESFARTIEINLIGSFNMLRLAAAEMAGNEGPERGVIINTASIAAFDGQKGQAAYAASKAGIAGMTLPLARDLASQGLRVCAIAPGIFSTPMMAGLPADVQESLAAEVTFPRRLGEPAEYAALAAFILECSYLNGEVIRLDGALRMR
ncbi:MAG: SDR family NAD(P)-dependent oxidoreductase [Phaeovulum sp.]|uniref:SDR family NAD(P)-dependent oxidoreductase n=1 Tax=Phaeovulum sp. TaxID=2934796 RepID=UPI002730348C|nr:SDR family NAD(P)-dependent oxidoreductase [Phaeovulum sp.]MDP2063165.1 SDR family NAD(P)-dependent oxidoreductase [Phaeovulum sp.]MDP3860646.1 SDR family NAD(P)-dependent oxidoreductase [Phaeovulum sp.]